MKALVIVSLICFLLAIGCKVSYAAAPDSPTKIIYPASVQILYNMALLGEKDKDGDWINKCTNGNQILSVLYSTSNGFIACGISNGPQTRAIFYDPTLNRYGFTVMIGEETVGTRELSGEEFDNAVKKFLELWRVIGNYTVI